MELSKSIWILLKVLDDTSFVNSQSFQKHLGGVKKMIVVAMMTTGMISNHV